MNDQPFKPLPALRSLGELADVQPVILTDSREQRPLIFTRLKSVTTSLQTGDYSFAGAEHGIFAIERKSIADAVASLSSGRERFFRECCRLRGFAFSRIIITGLESEILTGRYRSSMSPASVMASLRTIEVRYGVPVIFAGTPENAALLIEEFVFRAACELVKNANALLRGSKATDESEPPVLLTRP